MSRRTAMIPRECCGNVEDTMLRPDTIILRHSDAETIEQLVEAVGVGPEGSTTSLLDEELTRATIVADNALPEGAVALGSRVRFRDDTGKEREITLVVPSQAALNEGRISVLSPVGSALIGLSVADEIDWPMPGGQLRRLRVLAVSQEGT